MRKPPGTSWESFTERQIREAMERGEFDDLPGAGKPLDGIDGPRDELWWVRAKLRREEVDFLPPTLDVRRQLDDARARIARTDDEHEVRRLVADINDRIRYVNSHATSGPPSTVSPLDVEDVVARWRDARSDE